MMLVEKRFRIYCLAIILAVGSFGASYAQSNVTLFKEKRVQSGFKNYLRQRVGNRAFAHNGGKVWGFAFGTAEMVLAEEKALQTCEKMRKSRRNARGYKTKCEIVHRTPWREGERKSGGYRVGTGY